MKSRNYHSTTVYTSKPNEDPKAWITVNKDRRRTHEENKVYLKDGQTFEIELKNTTSHPVLAKLEIQGETSDSGLVLRPGEHTFLKRYINENKAFKFGTYEVSKESRGLIQKNGKISIKFYQKDRNTCKRNRSSITWDLIDVPKEPSHPYPWDVDKYRHDWRVSRGDSGAYKPNSSLTVNGNVSIDSPSKKEDKIKTGRVEPGKKTNQNFNVTNERFKSFPFHTIQFTLSPASEKENKQGKNRMYCTECGAKQKQNWKFCAYCGTKFE